MSQGATFLSGNTTETILEVGDCKKILKKIQSGSVDLVVTSPPYFIGKKYDESKSIADYETLHREILPQIVRVLRPGGSVCWQTGYHVEKGHIVPLDFLTYSVLRDFDDLVLRNRIIWRFGHGLHSSRRFSGRHETVLWYTKGDAYNFDLDAVRVPQKYPGKRHFKGPNKGELSGNPKGKNPSDIWDFDLDVWDIPNVKGNHIEKSDHPCQFPVALPRRLIKALTKPGELVLDPFMGAGSTGVAAILEKRRFRGMDTSKDYVSIARARCEKAALGTLAVREDVPIIQPDPRTAVATRPDHFVSDSEDSVCEAAK